MYQTAAGFYRRQSIRLVTFVISKAGLRLSRRPIMNPRDAQLLDHYSSLEYILLGDLRDLLEEPVDDESRKWLLAVLDTLLDTLPREFDLEDEDGYMSEVL